MNAMSTNKISVCISDADVLVKLSITGYLGILGEVFEQVIIVEKVEQEARKKIGKDAKGTTLFRAQKDGWLKIISAEDRNLFDHVQRTSINLFKKEYDCVLDPGELESAAVANELQIKFFLSDDANAKRIIQHDAGLDIIGLSYWEILIWAVENKVIIHEKAEQIFNSVNSTRSYPIKGTFNELYAKTIDRLNKITWE